MTRPGQFQKGYPGWPGETNGQWRPAMERFVEKLAFDPFTGCVM